MSNDSEQDAALLSTEYRDRMAETWQMLLGIGHASSLVPKRPRAPSQSIPFTLITGFLGSGKTTLLNGLLDAPGGHRIAVLVNDFGAINIDASLLRSRDAQSIDLTNGCVCCSVGNGLAKTLLAVVERDDPPEAIVLEASGLAEPPGVVQIALSNPALRLNGIVAVVDADAVLANLRNSVIRPTIERQVVGADIVLVNKIDLVTDLVRDEVRSWLTGAAVGARLIETSYAKVPADIILGSYATGSRFRADDGRNDHAESFESFVLTTEADLDEAMICELAGSLPGGVLRAKGILRLSSDRLRQAVLQVTGRRWTLTKGPSAWIDPTLSELVVIGFKNQTDRFILEQRFRHCEAKKGSS